jgi:hypothetical protein
MGEVAAPMMAVYQLAPVPGAVATPEHRMRTTSFNLCRPASRLHNENVEYDLCDPRYEGLASQKE